MPLGFPEGCKNKQKTTKKHTSLARHVFEELIQCNHRQREAQHSKPLGGVKGSDLENCLLRWNKGKGRGRGKGKGREKAATRKKKGKKGEISKFSWPFKVAMAMYGFKLQNTK